MKTFPIKSQTRRNLCKSIARGSNKSLLDHCYKDTELRRLMVRKIGRSLKKEIKRMCAPNSKFCCKSFEELKNFQWADLLSAMATQAPTLASILQFCTETKTIRNNRAAVMCVCAGILFKFHFSQVNLIQKIISLILHAGHSGKMVSTLYFTSFDQALF